MADNGLQNPGIKIAHNGNDLNSNHLRGLEKVTVEHEINVPGMFQITMALYDMEMGGWAGVDLTDFQIGDKMEISLGIDGVKKIISGEITAIDPVFSPNASLTIRGFDKLHRLRFGTFRRSFLDIKDSDIVQKLSSEASLSARVEATSTVHPYVFQNNISNYQFLLERAVRIGYELIADGDNLIYRASKEGEDPSVKLEYGVDLHNFSASLKALNHGSKIEVRGWDVAKKSEISGKAKSGDAKTTMKGTKDGFKFSSLIQESEVAVVEYPAVDASNAEEMAKAMYNILLKNFITGEGECTGNNKLTAGATVELAGLGKSFSGSYYLIRTTHIYDIKTGYLTRFKAKRTGA